VTVARSEVIITVDEDGETTVTVGEDGEMDLSVGEGESIAYVCVSREADELQTVYVHTEALVDDND